MLSEQARSMRIKKEIQDLDRQRKLNKIPSNIKYELIINDGALADYDMLITITGRQDDNLWKDYQQIQGILKFPKNYPLEPPSFSFDENFQHIHVYEGGAICLPLITFERWEFKTSLLNILLHIEDFIHRPPNLSSPANSSLYKIYITDRKEYDRQIIEQAKRYQKEDNQSPPLEKQPLENEKQ